MRITITILPLAFILLFSCSPVGKQNRIKHIFELGTEKLNQGSYDEAIEILSKAIELDEKLADAYMNRGVAYYETGHYVLALADYNMVYNLKPDYIDILFNRSYAYFALERYSFALEDLDLLRNAYPDTTLVDLVEGLVWEGQREYNRALLSFSNAIDKDTNNGDAWANRGTTYFHLGEFEQAKNDLLVALSIYENEPMSLNSLALAYAEMGQLALADSVINLALAVTPNQPYFLNNKAYVQILLGNYDLADSLIRQSLRLDSTNASAKFNLEFLEQERK